MNFLRKCLKTAALENRQNRQNSSPRDIQKSSKSLGIFRNLLVTFSKIATLENRQNPLKIPRDIQKSSRDIQKSSGIFRDIGEMHVTGISLKIPNIPICL